MNKYSMFEDESVVWTPVDNQSLKNKQTAEAMFPAFAMNRPISVIIEAKQVDGYSNIITK